MQFKRVDRSLVSPRLDAAAAAVYSLFNTYRCIQICIHTANDRERQKYRESQRNRERHRGRERQR